MSTEQASTLGAGVPGQNLNVNSVVDQHRLKPGVKLAKAMMKGMAEDVLTPRVPKRLRKEDEEPLTEAEQAQTEEGYRLRTERARRIIATRDQQRKDYMETVMPTIKAEAVQRYGTEAFKGVRAKNAAGRDVMRYTREQLTEQTRLLGLVQDLVAERRDLARSLLLEEKKMGAKQKTPPPVKRFGKRRVVLSQGHSSGAATPEMLLSGHKRMEEIDRELSVLGAVDGLRTAYERKLSIAWLLARITKYVRVLEDRNAQIDDEIALIRKDAIAGSTGVVTGIDLKKIEVLNEEKRANEEKIDFYYQSQDGYSIDRAETLHEYANAYARRRIIEIPSVKKIVNKGLEHMQNNQPFLLAGHLGSGKTEVARHMAKLHMLNHISDEDRYDYSDPKNPRERTMDELYDRMEPEFFSGSDEATVYDLIGKLKLKTAENATKTFEEKIDEVAAKMEKANVLGVPRDEIAKILLGKGDATVTVFNYGPFARALKRGVPIIIDEVNRISQQTNSRINDLLLRRPGTRVRLQENGEEEIDIGEGYAVIGTCNLGPQYSGINKFDAAFKSRWVAEEVGYPALAETYDLILASLLRKDRVRLPPEFPPESFERLVDLAMAVHEIQEIFSGRSKAQRFMAMKNNVVAQRAQLKEAVVSTRDLMRKIIAPWIASGFKRKPEDEAIARADLEEVEGQAKTSAKTAEPSPAAEVTPPPEAEVSPDADVEVTIEPPTEEGSLPPIVDTTMPSLPEVKDRAYTDGLDEIIAKNILASEVFSSDDQKLMTELFIRLGFFVGWSEKRFLAMGVKSVSQEELKTLHVLRGKEEYVKQNKEIDTIRASARQQTAALFAGLTSGNFGMMRPEEEKVVKIVPRGRSSLDPKMGIVRDAA